jgi:predicted MFS family arabinose efflux permease
VLLFGVLAFVASSTGLAFLSTPALLPLIAVLAAAGRATVNPLALAIASSEFEGEAARRAVSRVTSSLGAAPIVGVPVITSVATVFDWRAAWLALAAVTLVAFLGLWKVFRSTSGRGVQATERPTARDLMNGYAALCGHRPSLALLVGTFLMGAGGWTVWTYLGAFVVQRHGFSTQEAGWAWMVVGIGLFIGSVLAGGRLGRVPLDALYTTSAIAAGLGLGLAFVVPLGSWVAIGLIGLGTLLHGITQVISALLLTQAAPTGRAVTMTLRGAASSLGSATGAALGGLLLQNAGFTVVGASAIVFCVVAAGLAWWVRGAQAAVSRPRTAIQAAT